MRRKLIGATLIVAAVVMSGCIVTFDGVNGAGNPILTTLTVTEQGETTVFTSGHFHAMGDSSICLFGGCVSNGTVYLAEEAGSLGQPINMRVSGSTFTLFALQVAQQFNDDAAAAAGGFPNATTLHLVGTTAGGTVQANCAIPNTGFGTCSAPGFSNLTSVTFSGLTASGGAGAIAIDSIQFLPGGAAATSEVNFSSVTQESGAAVPGDPVSKN